MSTSTSHAVRNARRYERVVRWAFRRYTGPNGRVVISTGGVPSVYSRIEDAAFARYMRLPRDASGALVMPQN